MVKNYVKRLRRDSVKHHTKYRLDIIKNMAEVENDIKGKYSVLREEKSKEIYFYNSDLFRY
jgi:hypothetical protein